MTSEYAKLIEILVKQRDVFVKLRQTMESGEAALRHYNASAVDEYNKSIEILKLRMDALEQARINQIARMVEQLGIESESPTLSDLAAKAPSRIGPALKDLKKQLKHLADSVALQNRKNHLLARASLNIVHDLGKLLGQVAGETTTYQPYNAPKGKKSSASVVSRRL